MSDYFKKYKSLFSTTTTAGFSTGTGETITLNSVVGLPTDTEITLTFDRVNNNKTATPTLMERITGTISGSNLVIRTSPASGRGADGTTEQAHSNGCVVEMIWNAEDWNDSITGALVEHNQDGTHKTATITTLKASGAQVTTGTVDNLAVTPKALADSSPTFAGTLGIGGAVGTNMALHVKGASKGIALTDSSGTTFAFADSAADTLAIFTGSAATPLTTEIFHINTSGLITPVGGIKQRVVTTTDDATAVIDCTITDQYQLSAVANATEFTVTGTPFDGQKLLIRFKDAGVSKDLTFTGFTAIDCTLPTATTAGKWGYVFAVYNLAATTWHVLAFGTEA